MRVGYLGTADFAAAALERLARSDFRPILVVTPPDRRQGRGRKLSPPPAAAAARELGLDLLQAESVNSPEALERIRAATLDVAVVCAFGQLIRPPLLDEIELLNIHPSLLPRWRGAAPIERAIMAGDPETGVTIMRVTEGLDSGPVALQEREPIAPDDDYGSLSERLQRLGGELAVEALRRHGDGALEFVAQDDDEATYADKIEGSERRLDVHRDATELERVVRALNPHLGTYVELDPGERLGVREAEAAGRGPAAGKLGVEDGSLLLGCGSGALRLTVVQPPGKRPMPADAYLRGHARPGSPAP